MNPITHQYIDRRTRKVKNEKLLGDRLVNLIYNDVRERTPAVFRALTSARCSRLLGFLNFDLALETRFRGGGDLLRRWGVDESECLDDPAALDTPRKLFTRKIKYWTCRPLPEDPRAVVSPADSRVLLGSLSDSSLLFIKNKFFHFEELLGPGNTGWLKAFEGGDFAVFRLTPEKYHYNHVPVAGRVLDIFEVEGAYHACNPGAVVRLATPFSKNKRVVSIIDTDRPGGTKVGLAAMIEVVALMVGEIEPAYSVEGYDNPRSIYPEDFLEKGRPKSLFKPGSSTVVLLFQPGRVEFDRDLLENQSTPGVASRFSLGFGRPLVETEVWVRSSIGRGR
ncbi:MAG: phosphatidylserine decarboxylase [Pseudomonadota bacterium]